MTDQLDLAQLLEQHIPCLRRYAHALSGTKSAGDELALSTLEAILDDRRVFDEALAPKAALFKAFHSVWRPDQTLNAGVGGQDETKTTQRLSRLQPQVRAAVLLKFLEAYSTPQIAAILNVCADDAEQLVETGAQQMRLDIVADLPTIGEDRTQELFE